MSRMVASLPTSRLGWPALVLFAWIMVFAPAASAQQCSPSNSSLGAYLRECLANQLPTDTGSVKSILGESWQDLKSPESLTQDLGELEAITGTRNLLRGLDLRFVRLEQDGGNGGGDKEVMGLKFDWSGKFGGSPRYQGSTHFGYRVAAGAAGTLAVDASENPDDFIELKLDPHVFFSAGGGLDSAVVASHSAMVADSLPAWTDVDSLAASEGFAGAISMLWDSLSTQVYLVAGPDARFEMRQDGSHRQWAVGGKVGVEFRDWGSTDAWSWLNLADWPAAALRWATGVDKAFRPDGRSVPTLELALHRVSADANPTRETVGDLDPFLRWSTTVRYRNLVARVSGGEIFAEAEWRYFREVAADATVAAAGLHTSNRFAVGIHGPGGLHLSWATGDTPLDPTQDDRWGVGFRISF